MEYSEFVERVRRRTQLDSQPEAARAINITLQTLGERLPADEADELASQLPEELGRYVRLLKHSESFSLDEFYVRVADEEDVELPVARDHARAVIAVLQEAVSAGEIDEVRAQLPTEYASLFESGE